ncbi:MAG: helix-turn-helix transcriptional regulator [Bacteroidota bacterium]
MKINDVDGRKVSLLFNNGFSKVVDLKAVLSAGKPVKPNGLVDQILSDDKVFKSVTIIGNSIGWPGIGKRINGFGGKSTFFPYDVDPVVLYDEGTPDERFNLSVGDKIKTLRKKVGLTQAELASRVGTTKHYISKLERNKSDVELLTLKKIVEAGLNGKLILDIEVPTGG